MRSLKYNDSELEKIFEEYKRGKAEGSIDRALNQSFCEVFPKMIQYEINKKGFISLPNNDISDNLDEESKDGSGGYSYCDFGDFVINLNGQDYQGRLWLTKSKHYFLKDHARKGIQKDGYIEYPADLQDNLEHQFDVCHPSELIKFGVQLLDKDGEYKTVELDEKTLELLEKNYSMNNIVTVEKSSSLSLRSIKNNVVDINGYFQGQ